jgi:hypothetical protein
MRRLIVVIGIIEKRHRARRKALALLAGGLVVSVGAFPTAASGVDPLYAVASVSSGHFDLQGSVDGETFTDHLGTEASPAAWLSFDALGTGVSPNDRVYVPFAVRLAKSTDYAARVTLRPVGANGDAFSQISVFQTDTFGCATAEDLVTAILILDGAARQPSAVFELAKPATGIEGAPANLCFVALAESEIAQGEAGTLAWSLSSESITD